MAALATDVLFLHLSKKQAPAVQEEVAKVESELPAPQFKVTEDANVRVTELPKIRSRVVLKEVPEEEPSKELKEVPDEESSEVAEKESKPAKLVLQMKPFLVKDFDIHESALNDEVADVETGEISKAEKVASESATLLKFGEEPSSEKLLVPTPAHPIPPEKQGMHIGQDFSGLTSVKDRLEVNITEDRLDAIADKEIEAIESKRHDDPLEMSDFGDSVPGFGGFGSATMKLVEVAPTPIKEVVSGDSKFTRIDVKNLFFPSENTASPQQNPGMITDITTEETFSVVPHYLIETFKQLSEDCFTLASDKKNANVVSSGPQQQGVVENVATLAEATALLLAEGDDHFRRGKESWQEWLDLLQAKLATLEEQPATFGKKSVSLFCANHELRRYLALSRQLAEGCSPNAYAVCPVRENYLACETTLTAGDLALLRNKLLLSSNAYDQQLAVMLEAFYRNANMRFVISETLLNRFVPEDQPRVSDVHQKMQNVWVKGKSVSTNNIVFHFAPNESNITFGLVIKGDVNARLHSKDGSTRVTNVMKSRYNAWKPFRFSIEGIHAWPAQIDIKTGLYLAGIDSTINIPIVEQFAEGIAKDVVQSRIRANKPKASREVKEETTRRINKEANERLGKASYNYRKYFYFPMKKLGLEPRLLDGYSTEEHLTGRIRIASQDQLGSHTPRPVTPKEVQLAIQVHQSLVNNVAMQIIEPGQETTIAALMKKIQTIFNVEPRAETSSSTPELDAENVKVIFAEENPIAITFDKGRAKITLKFASLISDQGSGENFTVEAVYDLHQDTKYVALIRKKPVSLKGDLGIGSQVALRGVFAVVFSECRPLPLLPASLSETNVLDDCVVHPVVLDGGWLSLVITDKPRKPFSRVSALRESLKK